ncbi:rhamnogalacturonan acetylesterase [Streptomyces mutabilis]|uniref:rhamnogalacturonan acetylesterase n=1 Tax=Streptomyces mutabilis TaxID=67332 RepID=UPI0034DE93FB
MSLSRRQVTAAAVSAVPLALAATGTARAGGRRSRTLFIAGDSTAAQKYADAAPETGWGMALPFFLRKDLRVANHAVNGRSSKSFVDEGRLDVVLDAIRPGDFLLVQFAHNDEKEADPTRYTEPWTTYQDHLRLYVEGARARGARPVLATPVERRRFDAAGDARPSHGEYPAAMRALARQEGVALLDVQALSLALWQRLGAEGTKAYFNWTATEQDNTHFNPPGAIAVARLVARELLRTRVLAHRDVRRLDEEIPESWIEWPASVTA